MDELLDELYQTPLGDFIERRTQIVKGLKAEGRKDEAESVRQLRKPSPAAWAVNQLHFSHTAGFQDLVDAGVRIKAAHEGEASDLASAVAERRDVLERLMVLGRDLLEEAGVAPTKDQVRRLSRTLEAAAGLGPDDDVAPGRLTNDLDPPGFGMLAGFALAAPTSTGSVSSRGKGGAKKGTKLGGIKKRATRGKAREKAEATPQKPKDEAAVTLAQAEASLAQAAKRLSRLDAEHDRAEADVRGAERHLEKLRQKQADQQERLRKADEALARGAEEAEAKADELADVARRRQEFKKHVDALEKAVDLARRASTPS